MTRSRHHRTAHRRWLARVSSGCLVVLLAAAPTSAAHLTTAATARTAASAPAAFAATTPTPANADPFGEHAPVVVVMDTSGSMEDQDASGVRRIDGARSAILGLIDALAPAQRYAMTSYPGNGPTDCGGAVVRTPLGQLNNVQASADVRHLRPDGGTPTGPALAHAASLLLADAGAQYGTIVLVSDGESNCGTPPCDVAKQIRAHGYDVVVNTVGFQVEQDAEEELSCIADATGGRYTPVSDSSQLADAVAAGAIGHTTVSVQPPARLAVTSGTSDLGDLNAFTITVGSDGRVPAADVRLTVRIDSGSQAGAVLMTKPVSYLGNLASGQSRTIRVQARLDHELDSPSWRVDVTARNAPAANASGTIGVSDDLTTDAAGPLLHDITRIAVLGDSYSSGEGAGDYRDAGADGCHRSEHTYGRVIWGKNALVIACSGAVTADLFSQQWTHAKRRVPPQLLQLRKAALSATPPQAVLVSIGGNDAGFTSVATSCIMTPTCATLFNGKSTAATGPATAACMFLQSCAPLIADRLGAMTTPLANMEQRVLDIEPSVTRALAGIDAAINDPKALARRKGKVAPILVMPYPLVTPPPGTGARGCAFGVSETELGYFYTYERALNDTVGGVAAGMAVKGRPFYVVSPVEQAFQPNHTACETTGAWVNVPSVTSISLDAGKQLSQYINNETLHPNVTGYRADARAIIAFSHTPAGRVDRPIKKNAPAPDWDVVQEMITDGSWLQSVTDPARRLVPTPADIVHAVETGFTPRLEVMIRLDSTPTVLGTTTADADGTVRANVRLPKYVTPGKHHLRFFGVGADGAPRLVSQDIRVWPVGMLPWSALSLLAVAALGWGLLAMRRTHVTPPQPPDGSGP